ncbi:hypothetical protein PFISCL1PPCAC_13117 [Pristionchus fissidentatus]|uniref:Nuclear receptor n=1 Tax=Pristionchus fissidentatus TaxID=1538716 RepID=A0AAV5VTC0_9BILA|nr:hypothetical protein PFISCL1PPCAC_13117 [Pristionchus fissidentatus]
MPRVFTKSDRECLVCGGKTTVAHMGFDVCRACTVFYRRSVGKRVYACRSNSNECPVGVDGVNCRKCRFDRIAAVVHQTGVLSVAGGSGQDEHSDSEYDEQTCEVLERPTVRNSGPIERQLGALRVGESACRTPLLARLQATYKTLCEIRKISELNLRPEPPHPLHTRDDKYEFVPATFASINAADRIFNSAALSFASTSFDEFDDFSEEEQWKIVMNFYYRFRNFESSYRADKAFPQQMDRMMAGYTTFLYNEGGGIFMADCPNQSKSTIEDSKSRIMRDVCNNLFRNSREMMRRIQPRHEEFIAIAGIMFWTFDGHPVSERAMELGEKYRLKIMKELNIYYREELVMGDYAARLGELLTFLHLFEKEEDTKEFFELLRLMNVFSDDSFAYTMIKE